MLQISSLENQQERERLKELFIESIDKYFREILKINPNELSDKNLHSLIPRNLMIDQNYIANWSINDYENTVKKLIKDVNIGRLDPAQYHKYLNRIYNDQSVVLDRDTILEPLSIQAKLDRVTYEGVRAMLLAVAGQNVKPFIYGEMGDGQGAASYGTATLYNPVTARVEIKQENDGSMILRGDTLFITCSFLAATVGFTQREFGLFDSIDTGDDKMYMYVQFDPADIKPHVVNIDVPTVSSSVNVCTL